MSEYEVARREPQQEKQGYGDDAQRRNDERTSFEKKEESEEVSFEVPRD